MPTFKSLLLNNFKTNKLSAEQRLALLESLSPLIDIDKVASPDAIKALRDDKELQISEDERMLLNMAYWQTVSPEVAGPSNARPRNTFYTERRRPSKRGFSGMRGFPRMEFMELPGMYPGAMSSMCDRDIDYDYPGEMRAMHKGMMRRMMRERFELLRMMGVRNQRDLVELMGSLPPSIQEEFKDMFDEGFMGPQVIRATSKDFAAMDESAMTDWEEASKKVNEPHREKEEKQD